VAGNGYTLSSEVSTAYTVVPPPANPTFTPAPGTYTGTTPVTIHESSAGAIVYYSVNGSTYAKYTTPISLAPGSTYTMKALGYTPNGSSYAVSAVVTGVYTIH